MRSGDHRMTPQQYGPLIGILIAVPLILLRNRQPQILRPQYLWIMPAILAAFIAFALWGMQQAANMPGAPPQLSHGAFDTQAWLIVVGGLLLGCAAGWWRGKMVVIQKEHDGTLKAQASPLGLILIVLLLVSRRALEPWLEANAGSWHVNVLAIQDAFLVFVVGMIALQRVEMFIRARRIQAGGTDSHVEATA